MTIFEIVCQYNIDLLSEADELMEQSQEEVNEKETTNHGISMELIQRLVEWDKRRRNLKDWQWNVMNEIVSGKRELNSNLSWGCKKNLELLKKRGFKEE